ncbi:MAG TPA: enoyl-CoA hydratase/isomerase family protein, partial [Candidatus Angelobacter sp.]|nr:enoyl-CoA hydratase/isomerase family protein [Candidatus Angelobacter sp.]
MDPVGAFDEVTDGGRRELRCAELVYEVAERFPGLVPSRAEIEEERTHPQKEKQGLEIAQGEFFARVLADPRSGQRLMHAMGRPRREAVARLDELQAAGRIDLGPVALERSQNVGWI